MSKLRAGIDFGGRFLHISVCSGGALKDVIAEPLPEGLVKNGRIVSAAAMGDFLREQRKAHKLRAREASLVLRGTECFCRRIETPLMTPAQLKVNLPYEFRDFVSEDKDKYFYDYAVLPSTWTRLAEAEEKARAEAEALAQQPQQPQPAQDGDGEAEAQAQPGLDMMAATVLKETIAQYREILKRGGFDLKVAVPQEIAYMNLLSHSGSTRRQCILDLGHSNVRFYMFDGPLFQSGRDLDFGLNALDDVVAAAMNVDPFIAATYRETNYQNCLSLPGCMDLYSSIGLEVMKAVNFFNFSSQGQPLEWVRCCGGGAAVEPLIRTLRETLPIPVVDCSDVLDTLAAPREGGGPEEQARVSLCATGAALQRR